MNEMKQYLNQESQFNVLPLLSERKTKTFALMAALNRKSPGIFSDHTQSDCVNLHLVSQKTWKSFQDSSMRLSILFINLILLR